MSTQHCSRTEDICKSLVLAHVSPGKAFGVLPRSLDPQVRAERTRGSVLLFEEQAMMECPIRQIVPHSTRIVGESAVRFCRYCIRLRMPSGKRSPERSYQRKHPALNAPGVFELIDGQRPRVNSRPLDSYGRLELVTQGHLDGGADLVEDFGAVNRHFAEHLAVQRDVGEFQAVDEQ